MTRSSLTPTLNVLANPIWVKCARSRLRWRSVVSWSTIVVTVTAFICVGIYLTVTEREFMTPEEAARALLPALIWIQAAILMGLGTGSVASGLARERMGGLLNYQRMTPMSPTTKIIGYLFGLPVREYFLFALTLPFVAFAVIKGQFPIGNIIHFYMVFFVSVWVYHMTGMVAGMASPRPILASTISVGMVLVLYFGLPRLELLGFKFFEHVTMLPAFIGLILNELGNTTSFQGDPFWDVSRIGDVAFFNWAVHPTVYTLIVQGFLVSFMFLVVHRKWRNEFLHPLSKISALIAYTGVVVFLIGNLWPIVQNPQVFDEAIERWLEMDARDAPSLPLFIMTYLFVFISSLLCLLLINLITPSQHTAVKGIHLARKLGREKVHPNSDAASSLPTTVAMILITSIASVALIWLAQRTGRFFEELPPWHFWLGPLLLNAVVFIFIQGLRERFSFRVFMISSFVLWMVPFFACTILWASESAWVVGTYVGLPFPPISQGIAMSSFFEAAVNVNDDQMRTFRDEPEIVAHMPSMTWLAVAGYGLVGGLLQLERVRWKRSLQQLPDTIPTNEVREMPAAIGAVPPAEVALGSET